MSHRLRLILIAIIIFAWAGIILSRLYILQIERSDEFKQKAERQYYRKITLTPKRGTIYDQEGAVLAINIDVPSVYAVPREIENPEETVEKLAQILQINKAKMLRQFKSNKSFVWVERKIDPQDKEKIEALELDAINFVTESKRIYPNNNLACHVLGFVGIDNNGLAGVEYQYDKFLRGEEGEMVTIVGAKKGYYFSSGKILKSPGGGNDVRLTINSKVQFSVQQELQKQVEATESESGTAIIMNPQTGAILAMANYPDYDPNLFSQFSAAQRRNRAVVDAYEPGSTFKLVTAAAAIEANVVKLTDKFDCEWGSIRIGSRTIRDHTAFGVMSFRDVIAHSSNVGTIKVAALVGENRLFAMADRFGYGRGTDVDLPAENRGILRPVSQWSSNSYGSVAIGQEVSGNPVQIILNAAIVANGGNWVQAHVVESVNNSQGEIIYETEIVQKKILEDRVVSKLRELTRSVVTDGGGVKASIEGINVAGKTGTGEIAAPGQGYIPGAYLASFIGYYPYEQPEVVMLCLLVKPKGLYYGGQIAAPLFKAIGERVANDLEILREGQDAFTVSVKSLAENLTQDVRSEVKMQKRTLPELHANVLMPDLVGMKSQEAIKKLIEMGLVPQLQGTGIVVQQVPDSGEVVTKQPVIIASGTGIAN